MIDDHMCGFLLAPAATSSWARDSVSCERLLFVILWVTAVLQTFVMGDMKLMSG